MKSKNDTQRDKTEILIVEDSPTQAVKLQYLLEENHYSVSVAQNGVEALTLLKNHKPTLIITDIVMPEMDGFELCQKVKSNKKLNDIGVILLTSLSDPEDIVKGLEYGADNFVTKPYSDKLILSRIQYVIMNSDLRHEKISEMGIELLFAGKKHFVTSNRMQILDLLVSTYESAVQKNRELDVANKELKELSEQLEQKVEERTQKVQHLNSIINAVRNVNQLIAKEKDRKLLLKGICECFSVIEDFRFTWIALTNESGKTIAAAEAGLGKKFSPMIKKMNQGIMPACAAKALSQSEYMFFCDDSFCNGCSLHNPEDKTVKICVSLTNSKRVYGLLVVALPVQAMGDEAEYHLLAEVANDIAFCLHNIETEEALQHERSKLDSIIKATTSGMLIINKDLDIIYQNPLMKNALGDYSHEKCYDLMKCADRESNHCPVFLAFGDGGSHSKIYKAMKPNNKIVYWKSVATPIVSSKGKSESCIVMFTEITENMLQKDRKMALQNIREHIWQMNKPEDIENMKTIFRDTLNKLGVPFKYFGINMLDMSSEPPEIYSYEFTKKIKRVLEKDERNRSTIIKFWQGGVPVYRRDIIENDEYNELEHVENYFGEKGKASIRSIVDVPFSNGTIAINSTEADAFSEYDINTLEEMAKVLSECFKRIEDLTNLKNYTENLEKEIKERKRAQDELTKYSVNLESMVDDRTKELKQALMDTEIARDKIDGIIKSVADGLIVTDKHKNVTLMNRAAEDLLNVRLSEVIDRPIDYAIEEKSLREKLVHTFNTKTESYTFDFKLHGDNPDLSRIMRARTSIIGNDKVENNGIVTIINDVTHEREVDRMKTEFISTAAHELRTPLTSIVGFSKILITKDNISDDERNRFLSYIHDQGVKLANIVGDLLDISRIESGHGIILDKEKHDICELIKNTIPYFQEISLNHEFEIVLPDEPVVLSIDKGKIEQLLKNILSNSVKYSPDGGLIRVSVEALKGEFLISVEDQGIGIKPEQIKKVFEKFYRVDASNSAPEGTGLGMVIIKYIVEAHNGKVWVESEFGQGTTIKFTIPMDNNKGYRNNKLMYQAVTKEGNQTVINNSKG